jgi:NIMA (never in mitosis gene a)-related kinase
MVNHPNIVKYLDDYQFNEKHYIVMELIETGNLCSIIEEYKFENKFIPEELILKFFSQLVSVLKYCYAKRIIHRNIKPSNILYLKSNVLKLADFGISRVIPANKTELAKTGGSSGVQLHMLRLKFRKVIIIHFQQMFGALESRCIN